MPPRKPTDEDGVTYLLRGIDGELWRRARSRAVMEGRTMREVLLDLLREYAARRAAGEPRSRRKQR